MSEYLAASRCIVGHVPASELPEPLVANEHYLPFRTAEECISQCEQLLSDVTSAAAMRMANERYYRANVEPAAHLRSILGRAFQRD
jgi:hypothetical protein